MYTQFFFIAAESVNLHITTKCQTKTVQEEYVRDSYRYLYKIKLEVKHSDSDFPNRFFLLLFT